MSEIRLQRNSEEGVSLVTLLALMLLMLLLFALLFETHRAVLFKGRIQGITDIADIQAALHVVNSQSPSLSQQYAEFLRKANLQSPRVTQAASSSGAFTGLYHASALQYQSSLGKLFNLPSVLPSGAEAQVDVPINGEAVVFLVDISKSMGHSYKGKTMLWRAKNILSGIPTVFDPTRDWIWIVPFHRDVPTLPPLMPSGTGYSTSALSTTVSGLTIPSGPEAMYSDMIEAMRKAQNLLSTVPMTRRRRIVLITDGGLWNPTDTVKLAPGVVHAGSGLLPTGPGPVYEYQIDPLASNFGFQRQEDSSSDGFDDFATGATCSNKGSRQAWGAIQTTTGSPITSCQATAKRDGAFAELFPPSSIWGVSYYDMEDPYSSSPTYNYSIGTPPATCLSKLSYIGADGQSVSDVPLSLSSRSHFLLQYLMLIGEGDVVRSSIARANKSATRHGLKHLFDTLVDFAKFNSSRQDRFLNSASFTA